MSTGTIAKHIVATAYDTLPADAIEATKKSILDTIGVMLPPTTLVDTCISLHELISEAGGKPESTVIGFGGQLPCWMAAFINGSLTHAVDFDDCVGLEKPLMHPTGSTLPAALATAERQGSVSGKDLIAAVAVGNDVSVRLAACPRGNVIWDYPFFPITTFGIFSAAAAAAKLLGLNVEQTTNALGFALNRLSGTTKGLFTSDFRTIRDGFNNREGILCALMAGKGMDASKEAFELLFSTYYHDDIDIGNLTERLGKHYRGAEVAFKPWPSCQGTHAYVQAALKIANENDIDPADIKSITLYGASEGENLCTPLDTKRRPASSITAKISLPFTIGAAMAHKSVTISDFLPQNLDAPEVLTVADTITFTFDPALGSYDARIIVDTKSGKQYRAEVNVLHGSLDDPLTLDDLKVKFRDCARFSRKPLTHEMVDHIIETILHLEDVTDIAQLTALLR